MKGRVKMDNYRGLWRGKRSDNDEWIEGYLMRTKCTLGITGTFILPVEINEHEYHKFYVVNGRSVEVNAKTLGECTGLLDKNGKPIFEGDIVEFNNQRFEVQFNEVFAAFGLQSVGNFITASRFTSGILACASVIGNIHDKPELLRYATGEDNGNED